MVSDLLSHLQYLIREFLSNSLQIVRNETQLKRRGESTLYMMTLVLVRTQKRHKDLKEPPYFYGFYLVDIICGQIHVS